MSQQQEPSTSIEQQQSTWEEINSFIRDAEEATHSGFRSLRQFQQDLPSQITQWKHKQILSQASLNQRHFLVCLTTLAVTSLTFRVQSGFIPVIRNSIITYALTGIMFTPEIVNPFIAFKKQ